MDNEAIIVLNYLNKNSDAEWIYVPWKKIEKALEEKNKPPMCLLGFRRKDVNDNASPEEKYMYFCRKDQPRMSQKKFLETHGKNLLQHLKDKFGDKFKITDRMPSLTITNSVTLYEAVPEPPVVKANISLELKMTLTCLDSHISNILEFEEENGKEFSLKANKTYDDIAASFGLKYNGEGKHIIAAGLSSSILGDHLTGSIEVIPIGPSLVEVTGGNEFQGNCVREMNGHKWKLEYKAGYKLDVVIETDKNKRSNRLTPFQLRVRSIVPVAEKHRLTYIDQRVINQTHVPTPQISANVAHHWYQNVSTWENIGACAVLITGVAGVVLTVATGQLEAAPLDAMVIRRGFTMLKFAH